MIYDYLFFFLRGLVNWEVVVGGTCPGNMRMKRSFMGRKPIDMCWWYGSQPGGRKGTAFVINMGVGKWLWRWHMKMGTFSCEITRAFHCGWKILLMKTKIPCRDMSPSEVFCLGRWWMTAFSRLEKIEEFVWVLWLVQNLGGGFKYFLFSRPFGEDSHFD